jgi:predicted peptidase
MQAVLSTSALTYLLHVPSGYTPNVSPALPLVVFLHGSGERGDDPALIKNYGLPRDLDDQPDLPFIVASPLCPLDVRWTDLEREVLDVLETVAANQNADRSRVYLTGFSMGGQGTWHVAARNPDLFAAVAPVAARIPPEPGFMDRLCDMARLPVWAAHGDADSTVPVDSTDAMVARLRECGGDVRYTRYAGFDHVDASNAFFEGSALYDWFATLRRPVTG